MYDLQCFQCHPTGGVRVQEHNNIKSANSNATPQIHILTHLLLVCESDHHGN